MVQFETEDWTVVAERKRLPAGARGEEVLTEDAAGNIAAWQFNAQTQCFATIVMYCRHADAVAVLAAAMVARSSNVIWTKTSRSDQCLIHDHIVCKHRS